MRGRVEIDLKRLKSNAERIRKTVPETAKIYWVVKADAYGHGIEDVVRTVSPSDGFCVATVEEGIRVRTVSPSPVLALGKMDFQEKEECVKRDISIAVWSDEDVRDLICITENMNKCASVHIALNTGMNRIGIKDEKLLYKLINGIKSSSKIDVKGVFSHLFDAQNEQFCSRQKREFNSLCKSFNGEVLRHLSASGKATDKDFSFDAVRVGLALYGYGLDGVLPCMSVYGEVVCVNFLQEGETVGYGGKFFAEKPCFIATLSLGYADGISRKRTGGEVIIKGRRRKIVGTVCMDFCFALVDEEVKVGDEAVFMGNQEGEKITAEDIARWEDTVPYEVLTSVKRIKYVYKG